MDRQILIETDMTSGHKVIILIDTKSKVSALKAKLENMTANEPLFEDFDFQYAIVDISNSDAPNSHYQMLSQEALSELASV